ncbi:3712_t:CDS:1 [Ambispora gerdemannii]|uniref:3712_t:CDS:1 n=1 Tax=Ambispora gerdemannii TaxID=144530 RepID=A0A9N9BZS5_9GLOM|nr:3712_t:CDS:1 [Ambispora gerdemannii]
MKTNFLFVFALLAMLCVVKAIPHQLYKRTTEFGPCPVPNLPSELSVTISPDPVVPDQISTFTVTGTLTTPITEDFNLIIAFDDPQSPLPFVAQIPPGTTVNAVENVPVPSQSLLPSTYGIAVAIINQNFEPHLVIGCAYATVNGPASDIPALLF